MFLKFLEELTENSTCCQNNQSTSIGLEVLANLIKWSSFLSLVNSLKALIYPTNNPLHLNSLCQLNNLLFLIFFNLRVTFSWDHSYSILLVMEAVLFSTTNLSSVTSKRKPD